MDVDLWDIDSPSLSVVTTELLQNGQLVDAVESKFGFRKINFGDRVPIDIM